MNGAVTHRMNAKAAPSRHARPCPQRPTAKELLRLPFIRKAKKTSYLIDLIDRHKKYKMTKQDDSDSSEETDSEGSRNDSDLDEPWVPTIRGPSSGRRQTELDTSVDNGGKADRDIDSMNHNNRIPPQVITQLQNGSALPDVSPLTTPTPRSPEKETPPPRSPTRPTTSLQRRHRNSYRARDSSSLAQRTDAIDELRNAFELAERSAPGISDQFVQQLMVKLVR
ncbi:serine/threonine-protein kinase 25-like [Pollicipes pollicipes]|uniref:serine/threonine-protein kinase 25-like n=1 Tax=Pollicipes pollicipes TaxID=41117 RepID=UPI00188575A1|nr:serine/threonine-protein kinase 25-like [Pollicipes pollicipes]